MPFNSRAFQVVACIAAMAMGALIAEQVSYVRVVPANNTAQAAVRTTPRIDLEPDLTIDVDMELSPDEVRTLDAVASHMRDGRIIEGAARNRVILFTFDDGPDRRSTPRLLQHLDDAGVKALFFVTTNKVQGPGDRIRAQAEILRDIVRRGHMVGNHTHEHNALPLIDTEKVIAEIETAQSAIEDIIGMRPWLFRPPGGTRSPRVDRLIADRGYTQVLWNLGTGDFQVRTAEEVVRIWTRTLARRERENGERGGIVLLHDTHPWSVEAFPMIMAEIRQRNCELLEQGEELFDVISDPIAFFQARASQREDEVSTLADPLQLSPEMLEQRQRRARELARAHCE